MERALTIVRGSAINYAQNLDPAIDTDTFLENMRIERFHSRWKLRYRHEDPKIAQSIVNHWADLGMVQLEKEQAAETMEPYVLVDLSARAHLPQTPRYQNRNNLVLAGTVIGFSIGLIVFDLKYRYFPASNMHQTSPKGE